ncbi:N-acetylmuramoyl-L-alanine amidase [Streptomyces sp. NPDC048436]|uniref:N-acetylmuramoyl-L-alanine amidase n=1 Tax=Streptomyces sp. NPDC048436 TaxID=3365550 RepID=UPI00371BAF19
MPGAAWRPISVNFTNDGQAQVRGVVVHIMAGTLPGTDAWFRNSRARASSHFGTGKGGALYQWVDTSDRAWAQAAGNPSWLSVENEGKGGDILTDDQLDRNAQVLAWAHKTYGVPLRVATSTSDRGLAYHGLGGSAWGGHTSCPGSRIVAQLPEIVRRAKKLTGDNSGTAPGKPKTVDLSKLITAAKHDPAKTGIPVSYAGARTVEDALAAEGLLAKKYVDGHFGTTTVTAYRKWQQRCGYSGDAADGIPGRASLDTLARKHGFAVTA